MHLHRKLITGTSLIVILLASRPRPIFTQTPDQPLTATIILDGTRKNDPVATIDFVMNYRGTSQRVKAGEPFTPTNPVWMRDAMMEIQNVSGKTIVGIWVSIFFPESDNGTSQVGNQVHVGARPTEAQFNKDGEHLLPTADAPLDIKTGDTWQIPLGTEYKNIKSMLEERRKLPYTQMKVRLTTVYFSDGTKWSPGYYGKPDPNRLGKYIEITPNDFYATQPPNR